MVLLPCKFCIVLQSKRPNSGNDMEMLILVVVGCWLVFACLFVCLFACLFACLFVCLLACLFCLFVCFFFFLICCP